MMLLKNININEYEEFISNYPQRNFLQSSYEGNKLIKDGWNVQFLAGINNNQIEICAMVCIKPLMKFFKYAYIPRGPIYDLKNKNILKDFYSLLKDYLKSNNCIYLEVDPNIPLQQRDKDGEIVENGFNNFETVALYKNIGFKQLPLKQGYDLKHQCRWISVLNLSKSKSKDELFKSFSSKTRQNINNAIKNQIKIKPLKKDELNILYEIVNETSIRRNFESLSLSFYQEQYDYFKEHAIAYYAYLDLDDYISNIKENIDKENKQLLKAQEGLKNNPNSKNSNNLLKTATSNLKSLEKRLLEANELKKEHGKELGLAAAMFIYYGEEVVYLMSGSKDIYKKFKGPYALQWNIIQDAFDKGYKYYNFYGISGYFKPDQEGYGVFDFKRGFYAEVVELIGNFILPIKPFIYKLFCLKQKI